MTSPNKSDINLFALYKSRISYLTQNISENSQRYKLTGIFYYSIRVSSAEFELEKLKLCCPQYFGGAL